MKTIEYRLEILHESHKNIVITFDSADSALHAVSNCVKDKNRFKLSKTEVMIDNIDDN